MLLHALCNLLQPVAVCNLIRLQPVALLRSSAVADAAAASNTSPAVRAAASCLTIWLQSLCRRAWCRSLICGSRVRRAWPASAALHTAPQPAHLPPTLHLCRRPSAGVYIWRECRVCTVDCPCAARQVRPVSRPAEPRPVGRTAAGRRRLASQEPEGGGRAGSRLARRKAKCLPRPRPGEGRQPSPPRRRKAAGGRPARTGQTRPGRTQGSLRLSA